MHLAPRAGARPPPLFIRAAKEAGFLEELDHGVIAGCRVFNVAGVSSTGQYREQAEAFTDVVTGYIARNH